MEPPAKKSSPILIAIAWLIVGVPAAWGVSQTVLKAADLFRPAKPVVIAPTTVPTTKPATTSPAEK